MIQKNLKSHAFSFSISGTSKDKQTLYELVNEYNAQMCSEMEFIDVDEEGDKYLILGLDLTNYPNIWMVAKGISIKAVLKMDRKTIIDIVE